ncbi:uncharacterized protein At3g49140-like [Chenopodium quinoa]|uniref:uncharacterized protein At3g49140-like n=1 Tax=Chenopodium quinoa TaxID=63459 RepID=UPI000B786C7D|nr:uncharacterized protein At3g49140-like [Chenopodium quinoa]
MMLIDSTMAIHLHSSSTLSYCRSIWSSGDVMGVKVAVPWNKVKKLRENFGSLLNKRNESRKSRIQATGKYLGSGSDHLGENGKSKYHPFEDISDSEAADAEKGQLTASETCRTIIEVNSKATLMFSGMINDEVHENIFWPDLPYLTDEHGNVYFQVNNDEDIMQSLTSDNNYVHVIIGLDTKEILSEMELSGPATIDFGIEEIDEEDSDFDEDEDEGEDDDDDEFDGDWVDILEVEEDHVDSDESLGDWAKLETMRASHPMYFAKKISEVTSDNPIDFMVQPPAGLAIQGLLRPAFIEERSVIKKHKLIQPDKDADINMNEKAADTNVENVGSVNGHAHPLVSPEDNSEWTGDLDKDNGLSNGTAFYKLEMIKIQLISAYGNQTEVEVEDYRKAHSDAIAHSASKIISRVSAAGEKTTNALKSLCWRSKGLQVEEASLIGVDSRGFDLRVCSGTQVQTLRFAFTSQATSEYSAERQLNDLLFPRSNQKVQKVKQTRRKEI